MRTMGWPVRVLPGVLGRLSFLVTSGAFFTDSGVSCWILEMLILKLEFYERKPATGLLRKLNIT
jgi:hypothetical protein